MSHSALIMVYYSLFHSVMTYRIIFWGSCSHSQKMSKIQKRAIRIIMGYKSRDCSMNLFKNLEMLPLKSQYIFSLLLLLASNRDLFVRNYEYHNVHTGHCNNLIATGQFICLINKVFTTQV
jgi:hypothetical protein